NGKMYNIKNGLDYQKKRAKRKDTGDEKFLTAVVNFFIMTLIVFCIVKAMNAAGERFGHKEEKAPDTKGCPYCKSKIAIA
ncbi:MscL family protein, partial [Agathobacter sp.]|uniref:MscL family protein n=2 Tax=Agathobacter sp. TaxID=2021311 RepID=UPI003AEF4245